MRTQKAYTSPMTSVGTYKQLCK
ncbi:unnamed protein product [Fusarium venenatum]|uniref:Uncharacterized protein n=1 Tax=Fusarium venenatum TaxID=56646 RepID=A0A2L2TDV2_9HYPO|nr:unnamed protein product [Fusarium venenatum]